MGHYFFTTLAQTGVFLFPQLQRHYPFLIYHPPNPSLVNLS
jgi:hypothetical protein